MADPAVSAQTDFLDVTELAGDEVSEEQINRLCSRYYWAAGYVNGKDVVELACGTGQGLGLLARHARTLIGSDFSEKLVSIARRHYGNRVPIERIDAQNLPFADQSKDVLILFEAIYYLSDPARFAAECKRVLKPGGFVLIATANKNLFDFNPSPYSHNYFSPPELCELFSGFQVECFGDTPLAAVSMRQKIFRPIKKFAVRWSLVPKTMAGKKFLKRMIFGNLEKMPAEISDATRPRVAPEPIPADKPNHSFKVIFCAAQKR